jgi:hypothetical protein
VRWLVLGSNCLLGFTTSLDALTSSTSTSTTWVQKRCTLDAYHAGNVRLFMIVPPLFLTLSLAYSFSG